MQAIGITLFESKKFGGPKISGGGGKHPPGKQSMCRSDRRVCQMLKLLVR